MGNTFGHLFRINPAANRMGVRVRVSSSMVVRRSLEISEAEIEFELDRRRPGQSKVQHLGRLIPAKFCLGCLKENYRHAD
jgi:chorismate synthase